MFKKIALIALFILVVIGVGYLLYRIFFVAPQVAPPPTGVATTTGVTGLPVAPTGRPQVPTAVIAPPTGLPTASAVANGGLTQTQTVSSAHVLQPQISPSGALNFYNKDDGKFYRQNPDGTMTALSQTTFPEAQKIEWAPQSDKAILEFPDNSKIIYDFNAQKQVTLPSHWQDFSFSGDGRSVAAKSIGVDPSNRWLINFAADGSDAQLIEPLGDKADKVMVSYSPDNSVVAFSDTADPVGFDTRDMLLIGKNNENFKSLRVEGFGFTPAWSPSGKHLVYSAADAGDNYQPTLWFVDAKGDTIGNNRTNLGVHTWADKCAYADESTVYCAVPDSLPDGAGLQRDIANTTPDSIVKVDLKNGMTTAVGRPVSNTTIKNIIVSPDGSKLFFTDAASGNLEQMMLR